MDDKANGPGGAGATLPSPLSSPSSPPSSLSSAVLLTVMALLFAAAAFVARWERGSTGRDPLADELLYYPSGTAVEKAALGHRNLAADIAWLRAVQYYGEHKRTDRKFTMMGHIVDIITDLDPQFVNAYIFGGLVTAEDAGDIAHGVSLMRKGVENNPDNWQMLFETGFVEYTCAKDYAAAAAHFRRAAQLPDAPEKVQRFAAFVSAKAGDPRAALFLWAEFAQRTNNEEMRKKALEQVEKLKDELARQGRSEPGAGGL